MLGIWLSALCAVSFAMGPHPVSQPSAQPAADPSESAVLKLDSDIQNAEDIQENRRQKMDDLRDQIGQAQGEIAALEASSGASRQDFLANYADEDTQANAQLTAQRDELAAANAQLSREQPAIDALQATYEEWAAKGFVTDELAIARANLLVERQRMQDLQNEVHRLELRNADFESSLARARDWESRSEADASRDASSNLSAANDGLHSLEQVYSKISAEYDQAASELSAMRTRYETLK